MREASPLRREYVTDGELAKLLFWLGPDEGAVKFLGGHRRGPRAGEGVEDEVTLMRGGEEGASHEP